MEKLIFAATAAVLALTLATPVSAGTMLGNGIVKSTIQSDFDRRRPRVPGGSGCDDPRDLIEHPECRR